MNKYKLTTYFINVTGTCAGDEDTDTVSWTQQHPVLEIYQLFWGSEKLALLDIGITEGKGIVYIHPAVNGSREAGTKPARESQTRKNGKPCLAERIIL